MYCNGLCVGIAEKKMETTIMVLCSDNGKANGNCRDY